LLASKLHEPQKECVACMDDFAISDMFAVDCPSMHRVCFDCMKRLVQHQTLFDNRQKTRRQESGFIWVLT